MHNKIIINQKGRENKESRKKENKEEKKHGLSTNN